MSRNIPKGALKLDQVGIVYFFVGRCTRIPTFPKVNVYLFMLHLMTTKEAFPFNIFYLVDAYLANCIKNTLEQSPFSVTYTHLEKCNRYILSCYSYEVFFIKLQYLRAEHQRQ